jgi:galactosyl transferase GMA12/MNN10 family
LVAYIKEDDMKQIYRSMLVMSVVLFQNIFALDTVNSERNYPTVALHGRKRKIPRIAILSLYNRAYAHIGKYSELNKLPYAKKHGYDVIIYHQLLDTSRPAAWSKIVAIQKHLKKYDWIFWSDADSLIMNNDIKVETLIDDNYDLIITREKGRTTLNTGSFLIKNTAWSHALLRDIYAQTQFMHHGWWEQAAFLHLLEVNPSLYNQIKILDQRAMNSHFLESHGATYQPGDFVIHFYGDGFSKAKLMSEWYEKSLKV